MKIMNYEKKSCRSFFWTSCARTCVCHMCMSCIWCMWICTIQYYVLLPSLLNRSCFNTNSFSSNVHSFVFGGGGGTTTIVDTASVVLEVLLFLVRFSFFRKKCAPSNHSRGYATGWQEPEPPQSCTQPSPNFNNISSFMFHQSATTCFPNSSQACRNANTSRDRKETEVY